MIIIPPLDNQSDQPGQQYQDCTGKKTKDRLKTEKTGSGKIGMYVYKKPGNQCQDEQYNTRHFQPALVIITQKPVFIHVSRM